MRTITFLSLLLLCVIPVCANDIVTPLSETNVSRLTPTEIASLSPLGQESVALIRAIELEREKSLENMIMDTPAFKRFFHQKVLTGSLGILGCGALITSAAQKISGGLSPYFWEAVYNHTPWAERMSTFAEKFPESASLYTCAGLGLSTAAALIYARKELKNPQLDAEMLVTIHDFEKTRKKLFELELYYLGMQSDNDMLQDDDYQLLTDFQQRVKKEIQSSVNHISALKSERDSQEHQLAELNHELQECLQERSASSSLKDNSQLEAQPVKKKKKSKIDIKFPAILTGVGIAGAASASASGLKRTYALHEGSSQTLSTAVLLGGSLILAGSTYAQDIIKDTFHIRTREFLEKSQDRHFQRVQQRITDATLDRSALHQEESRHIAQKMDLTALDALNVRTYLERVLKQDRIISDNLEELTQLTKLAINEIRRGNR